jgi:LmbE family N-acetylglucosaminyl deacetylase
MISLSFIASKVDSIRILCLGAHSDDIEIGCGGTLIRLFANLPNVEVLWVIFSATQERSQEAKKSAGIYLARAAKKEIVVKSFRDGFFPHLGSGLKEYFETIKHRFKPDIIFTHYGHDLHQDHRLVSELTWNTFRDHFILEYEILKYDGDLGSPNLFVPLERSVCEEKLQRLMDCFESQRSHSWFDKDSFYALMRIRGIEANSPTKYAEAFYCRKMVLDSGCIEMKK